MRVTHFKKTIDNVDIAFKQMVIDSKKPTVIFLHDSLGCIELWRSFPDEFCQTIGCNALIYDRQGYGQSAPFDSTERTNVYLEEAADFLLAVIKEFQISQPMLFGHSDGGSIALIAAAKRPDLIVAIITEGAHIYVEDITIGGIQHAVQHYEINKMEKRLRKYHGDKARDVFFSWANTWLRPSYRMWNIMSFLPSILCPALIIQGEEDEFGTLNQVSDIIDQISGDAQSLILPNVGHNPHKETPTKVIKSVFEFIQTAIF